jgi:hypothetical protein
MRPEINVREESEKESNYFFCFSMYPYVLQKKLISSF